MTDPPRKYKEFTPRMGIYRVTHTPSGRTLLGQSAHVQGMLNRIRFQLGVGAHTNKVMQRDWQQDGEAAFSFEVLDELTPQDPNDDPTADLKELLALWLEKLNIPVELRY